MDTNLGSILQHILDRQRDWEKGWPDYSVDATLTLRHDDMLDAVDALQDRLRDNYPFFHPMYAGQMLKPPHPAAVLGYVAAMLINPNNHALDGGPATGQIEKELIGELAAMFGYDRHLGHLTSSGTIANLEALWVCRQLQPGKAVAYSDQSHYTHSRMCEVLGIRGIAVPSDAYGRMDTFALDRLCLSEDIGAVVATIGTTGLGALDPLPALVRLRDRHGFRIHADAAYGGFFRLIGDEAENGVHPQVYASLAECDSIVVDPHKHGLQPYGCGCVLFRDPDVGRFYVHDSPYTYFTSKELHLGEISLECSRAGAAAAALWTTLRLLPLEAQSGLGAVLRRCRSAALQWADMLRVSDSLCLLMEPELDIVVYFPNTAPFSASAISAASAQLFDRSMRDAQEAVYLSTFRVKSDLIQSRYPQLIADTEWTTVLRSVLMKPEQADWVGRIHRKVEECTAEILAEMWNV
ncbi:MAG: aminotransferase class I/II-fold pyridoxal phosphate-dependent enzyme [Bacteroidia bacterium]|nr:aminotransferase class I/II-fold pyridoxal phosphate-dependent enzyme [Bacteroidia bacterium]